jgi:parallel beta-helix repeat protein
MGLAIVPADSSLTIEPGVRVEFKSSANDSAFVIQYLDIGWIKSFGNIVAIGSETDSIIFTSMGEGHWGGIHFENVSEIIHFKFCKIEKCRSISDELIPGESHVGGLTFKNSHAIVKYSNLSNSVIGMAAWNSEVDLSQNKMNNNILGTNYFESSGKVSSSLFSDNYDYGIFSHTSSVKMENNIIEEQLQGIHSYESSDTIIGNILRNNLWGGIQITRCNPVVFRNVVYGSNSGMRCDGNPRISNNTIINNNYFGIYCDWHAKPILINNIIYGNGNLIHYNADDTVVFANCLLQVNTLPADLIDAGGNIFNEDPLFVDPGNENFSLNAGSPCINAGIAYFEWEGEVYLELDAGQYTGIAPDIGAIESTYVGEKNDFSMMQGQVKFVFPNPATGEIINLYYNGTEMECEHLVIQNLLGYIIHQQEIRENENMINISDWPSGIYLAVIYKERKAMWRSKIVVQ